MSAVGEKLINEIRAVAQRYPDKTDQTSRYVIDGRPRCLIGHALLHLHRAPGFISRLEQNCSLAFDRLVDSRALPELAGIRGDETMWVSRVQKAQDLAETWATAVTDADGHHQDLARQRCRPRQDRRRHHNTDHGGATSATAPVPRVAGTNSMTSLAAN